VELLLQYGADVNSLPFAQHGATVLQFAAIYGHAGIALLLLNKGARVDVAGAIFLGRTALE
jgi:ankyrin repeat protein